MLWSGGRAPEEIEPMMSTSSAVATENYSCRRHSEAEECLMLLAPANAEGLSALLEMPCSAWRKVEAMSRHLQPSMARLLITVLSVGRVEKDFVLSPSGLYQHVRSLLLGAGADVSLFHPWEGRNSGQGSGGELILKSRTLTPYSPQRARVSAFWAK